MCLHHRLSAALLIVSSCLTASNVLLPDGQEFVSWEKPLKFSKTYYVNNRHPSASDSNAGTEQAPFLTIGRAAELLQPGERAVIAAGVYRERVAPARGGDSPDSMISYEAAPGAQVLVKGSRLVKNGWEPSRGFDIRRRNATLEREPRIYQLDLSSLDFGGYNPFGMVNVLDDRSATTNLGRPPQGLKPYLARRGMVFVDGKRLEQVELYRELALQDGAFWVEHHGLTLHVRLPGDADPAAHEVELVIQEQVFAPKKRHLAYIRVKGITFEHAANGFPVPQRGLVSANRGHHWIIEDCTIRHANAVALDIGNETWNADRPEIIGHSIVRRNHISDAGVCGLAGMGVRHTLVEYNTIERVSWQNVEGMWESGGIKLHLTKHCLLRGNVIRRLRYAPGIWIDYGNTNTRVTGNVIGDIQESLRGGIYLEASHDANMLDHNIICNTTMAVRPGGDPAQRDGGWCIINDGSDEAVIAHNLLVDCENAAVQTRTVESRVVEGRGGTARWNDVRNNIFLRCGKNIEFSHRENFADGNLYAKGARALNWITRPENLRLDLFAWQRYFDFDKNGGAADLEAAIDIDALTLTWAVSGPTPEIKTTRHFARDFTGRDVGPMRKPGPFATIPAEPAKVSINPGGISEPQP